MAKEKIMELQQLMLVMDTAKNLEGLRRDMRSNAEEYLSLTAKKAPVAEIKTLSYTAASEGDFIGHLSYAADVSINKSYKIRISVNDGSGKRARWDVRANTIYRDGD